MKLTTCLALCAALWAHGNVLAQNSWWSTSIWKNPERGTFWYPPARADQEPVEPPKPDVPPSTQRSEPPEVADFKALQEKLIQLRMVYMMSPTPDNVKAYIQLQEAVMARSASAADTWRRVIWDNPDLQYQGRPTNQTGLGSWDQQYGKTVRSSLASLASTHGVYFFFRSDCPYCHAMAPTLKQFEQTHGIKVIAVSLDGKGIAQFPNAITDKGQAQQLGVQSVPSFFLAAPARKSVLPLGTGVVSLSDLEDRIYTQAFTRPGDKF